MRKYQMILLALALSLGLAATAEADGGTHHWGRGHHYHGRDMGFYAMEFSGGNGTVRFEIARGIMADLLAGDIRVVPVHKERLHREERHADRHRVDRHRPRLRERARVVLRRFARLDANNDRFIDRHEYRSAGRKRFNRVDLNRDGLISRAEFLAQAAPARKHRHDR